MNPLWNKHRINMLITALLITAALAAIALAVALWPAVREGYL